MSAFLRTSDEQPIVTITRTMNHNDTIELLYRHLLPATVAGDATQRLIPVWVENWVRLGLAEVSYLQGVSGAGTYDWAKAHPLVEQMTKEHAARGDSGQIDILRGYLSLTPYGKALGAAVGV